MSTSDDRPLVVADPMAAQAEWSDRVLLWWEDNRRLVGASLLLLLVAIVGWQSYVYLQDRRERLLRDEYATLVEPADLQAFAIAHPSHPLAGVAHLTLADQHFEGTRYAESVEHYAAAATALAGTPYGDRARLGHAMAQLMAGQHAAAEASLDTLRQDTAAIPAIRAEAAYQLAVRQWETDRLASAKSLLEFAAKLENAGLWTQRAQALLDDHADFR